MSLTYTPSLDAYEQCILLYVYFENRLLFNVIISRRDTVVKQYMKTIYKGKRVCVYYETV